MFSASRWEAAHEIRAGQWQDTVLGIDMRMVL
jgi:hypothetical protein